MEALVKRFYLEVLSGAGTGRKVEVFSSITLGRSHGNDLAFAGEDAGIVSGHHALVALKAQSLWLRDLDSTNGTFVGKVKVTERELLGGEIISLGQGGPALRVEVADVPTDKINPGDTVMALRETVGLMSGSGNRSLILEMAKKLKKSGNPNHVMQGLVRDPDRLARLLRGGVMPERVADWVGTTGNAFAKSRRRFLWMGVATAVVSTIAVSFLTWQNLSYRAHIKKQGDLLSQIRVLELGLQGLAGGGEGSQEEKERLVSQLVAAEKQLFKIRGKLKLPDRAGPYRLPLGGEVHQVLEELGKKGFIVPESFIKTVQGQLDHFTRPENRATIIRCFARKPRYEGLIARELSRMKLPADFIYIAMQESLLDSLAQSGSDARGLWQLVPGTARELELEVPENWKAAPPHLDQRTNPKAATRAAAKYLHLLYSEFGDAALAMAAYNAGGNKMRRVLRRIEDPVNDRDFWYLYRMGLLPDETGDYVPKIIAMILIDRNRAKYGFKG